MAFQPLWKPRPRVLERHDKARAKASTWRQICAQVSARDKGKCRCCGAHGSHHHHILYRSHGGKDDARNVILLCELCHQLIHAKVIRVTYREPDRAKTIRFVRDSRWPSRETRQ